MLYGKSIVSRDFMPSSNGPSGGVTSVLSVSPFISRADIIYSVTSTGSATTGHHLSTPPELPGRTLWQRRKIGGKLRSTSLRPVTFRRGIAPALVLQLPSAALGVYLEGPGCHVCGANNQKAILHRFRVFLVSQKVGSVFYDYRLKSHRTREEPGMVIAQRVLSR